MSYLFRGLRSANRLRSMAEKQRFELWRDSHPLAVFKTAPFSHLGISPNCSYDGGPGGT